MRAYMKIELAKTAGFCFGVNRAIKAVEKGIQEGKNIATYGPIIHNERVVKELSEKGVRVIEDIKDARPDETIVIRSHGVPKNIIDELTNSDYSFIDATCPYVKKIQQIVNKYSNEGYTIVIVGDKDHPEVVGINGWCNNKAIIINDMNDIPEMEGKAVCAVAQTTINRDLWNFVCNFLKSTCQEALFFDTICSATKERQAEAQKLAENCDICFVIGGKSSSNTNKLYTICKERCAATYYIDGANDLPSKDFYSQKRIGVTAGASTPDWIIKEVLNTMQENEIMQENMNGEENWAQELENSLITIHTRQKVKGTVVEVRPNEVIVNLNYKSDGVIPASELTDDPFLKPEDIVKKGDVIEVFVVRVNDVEGTILLSKKKIDSEKGFETVEKAFEDGTTLYGFVAEVVNGGVIAICEGVRVFVPASQANDRYLSDLSVLVDRDKKVPIRILQFDRRKRKIVGSIKAVLVEERKKNSEEFWATAEKGKEYTGTVKTITPFGAFVDIGGVDGLVHISEMTWSRIKHPSEVMKEGDTVNVYIIDANKETNKIALGYKKIEDNPWEKAKESFKEGDVVKVKVSKIVPFGAFVELAPGVDGLVHISQIANKRVVKPSDELSVGQEIDAKIIEMNLETKKIGLSIRALLPEVEVEPKVENVEETIEYKDELPITLSESMEDIKVD